MGWNGISALRINTGGDEIDERLQKAYDEGYEDGCEEGWRKAMEEAQRSGLLRSDSRMTESDGRSSGDGMYRRGGYRRRR